MTDWRSSKHLSRISKKTQERCSILLFDPPTQKKFVEVSLELFHFFYAAGSIPCSLYFGIGDLILEFVTPATYSKELLDQLYNSTLKKTEDIGLFIQKKDRPAYFAFIDSVRERKIKALLEDSPELDAKVLNVYSNISSASQMVVKGGVNAEVAQTVAQTTAYLVDNLLDSETTVSTLSKMIICDDTLYDHSATVAMLSVTIGSQIPQSSDKKEALVLGMCGLYHDIGKTCIPSAILNKPGKFTKEEFEIMKTHSALGAEELEKIAQSLELDERIIRVAGEHHENFDGTGYPKGKKGCLETHPETGIHPFTRIVTIADVYSALLMKRVYKEAYEAHEALKIMTDIKHKFDPDILNSFLETVKISEESQKKSSKGKLIIIDQGKVSVKKTG